MVFIPVRDEHGIKLGASFGILLGSEVEGSREGIYESQNIVRCLVGIVTTVDQHCREHKRAFPDGLAIWPVSRKLNQEMDSGIACLDVDVERLHAIPAVTHIGVGKALL